MSKVGNYSLSSTNQVEEFNGEAVSLAENATMEYKERTDFAKTTSTDLDYSGMRTGLSLRTIWPFGR